jgi:hypothetical protein
LLPNWLPLLVASQIAVVLFDAGEVPVENVAHTSPCQARLAALARDITGWEDDLSHSAIKCVVSFEH